MNIIELVINEDEELSGVDAISVVEQPAIEEDFVALKNQQQEIKLAQVSAEKRILMGAALVPEKPIYRSNGQEEFYIYFSKDTVAKASQMFLRKGNQNKATLEHAEAIGGMTVVESWLVEDDVHDKSRKYGLNVPVGTWMVSMKVYNDEVWNDYVKTGKVKGFSIEGYFADKLQRPQDKQKDELNKQDEDCECVEAGKNTKSPCWDGYRQDGYKTGKDGKKVPNCVKIKNSDEELLKKLIDALQ